MPYKMQLWIAAALALLASGAFYLALPHAPDISPRADPSGLEVAIAFIIMAGLLIAPLLAVAFGVGALVWTLSNREPDTVAMPLGARIKGAGLIFVVAMLSYASFFLFA